MSEPQIKPNNKKFTLSSLCLEFSLQRSWDYHEFQNYFGITLKEASQFSDLFNMADHQIYVYEDAQFKHIKQFSESFLLIF